MYVHNYTYVAVYVATYILQILTYGYMHMIVAVNAVIWKSLLFAY